MVLPVLLAIVLGILFFGRYESYSGQMTHLSEEGVRDAAVNFTVPTGTTANGTTCATGNLACYVASQATGELATGNGSTVQAVSVWVDCNSNASGATCTAGNNVTVCLRTQVSFPGLSNVGTYSISQQAVMRIEQGSAAVPGAQDSYFTESSSNTPSTAVGSLGSNPPC